MNSNEEKFARLFDLVDDVCKKQWLQDTIELPYLVAAGDQSSGKSSVLARLTNVQFPTGDGAVTKFATRLSSRKLTEKTCEVTNFWGGKETINLEGLGDYINRESADNFKFDRALDVKITGPSARNISVVDLPGIVHTMGKIEDAQRIVEDIRQMVRNNLKDKKAFILCVIDISKDFESNEIFGTLGEIDKDAIRTIVVFTKFDKIKSNKELVEERLKEIQKTKKFHNYRRCFFVNATCENDEKEEEFFAGVCNQYKQMKLANCTFHNLYSTVCEMMLNPVTEQFKESWSTVRLVHDEIKAQIAELEMATNPLTNQADELLFEFLEQSRDLLKGNNADKGGYEDLFHRYRECFEEFKKEYAEEMESKAGETEMKELVDRWRKREPKNFTNYPNFKSHVMPIVTSFMEPAVKCYKNIAALNKEAIEAIINITFAEQTEHRYFLKKQVANIIEKRRRELNSQINILVKCEEYLYCDDELFEKTKHRREKKFSKERKNVQQQQQQQREKQQQQTQQNSLLSTAVDVSVGVLQVAAPEVGVPLAATRDLVKSAVAQASEANESSSEDDSESEGCSNKQDLMSAEGVADSEDGQGEAKEKYHLASGPSSRSDSVTDFYTAALETFKEMAMDRISTVIPAHILFYMNHLVQRDIQLIDRNNKEFSELEWTFTEDEKHLEELRTKCRDIETIERKFDQLFSRL